MGLGDRFEEVELLYARCDGLLGRLVKVTPTSKVVGDLALYLLSSGLSAEELEKNPQGHDLPESVVGFLRGELGTPPGGWPEPFRSRALEGKGAMPGEVELSEEDRAVLLGTKASAERRSVLDRLLLPGPAAEKARAEERYGDVSVVPTGAFLYGLATGEDLAVDLERGVRIYARLEAITEADERGIRTLMVSLNGQPRPVDATDRSLEPEAPAREKANPHDPGHVAAPMSGVATLCVGAGEEVEAGQQVGTIEAMKMESAVRAPVSGTVERLAVPSGTGVEPGDLLLVLRPD
jgi:pyruvate carboxylase